MTALWFALLGGFFVLLKEHGVFFGSVFDIRYLFGLVATGLLGQKNSLDVGQNTSLGDGHSAQQLVQLLVITDGQLQVTGNDPGLLVVTGCVSCQLQHLGSQVLHHCSQVHWRSSTDPLRIVALAKQTVDTTHGEL